MSSPIQLLTPDALKNVRLGISISESPDLAQLGLLESHFRMAIGEIARSVLILGGHLFYGGHLQTGGYTDFLINELERYSRRDQPLTICLAWTEHRKVHLSSLDKDEKDLGLYGKLVYLDVDGAEVKADLGRTDEPILLIDEHEAVRSLTGLRRYMSLKTNGRILIGGKRSGYAGNMPGVLEEALISVQEGKPIYLAGGFGGITTDIANALDLTAKDWLPATQAKNLDAASLDALTQLAKINKDNESLSLRNGLTGEENRRLAGSHRPSEIAALVSLGLARRFSEKGAPK